MQGVYKKNPSLIREKIPDPPIFFPFLVTLILGIGEINMKSEHNSLSQEGLESGVQYVILKIQLFIKFSKKTFTFFGGRIQNFIERLNEKIQLFIRKLFLTGRG
jgi:hypothetical protein